MSFTDAETSVDGFLGGRLQIRQPLVGYRAATDPVFLAASMDACVEQKVLELGCGVGVASLCLASRVAGVRVTGLELQADYVDLARKNADENGIPMTVMHGDLNSLPASLREQSFDQVMMNPPFFDSGAVSKPKDAGKATAHVIETALADWIDAGLRRLKPNGILTIIQLTPQLPEILAAVSGRTGDIAVLPLTSRQGRAAKRVIVRAKKGARAPLRLLAPFHIHDGAEHVQGSMDYTTQAKAILRDGAALRWE